MLIINKSCIGVDTYIVMVILTVIVLGVNGALKRQMTKLQCTLITRTLSSAGVDANIAIIIVS